MGATASHTVAAAPGLELVAAVDPNAVGREVHGISIAGELRALADAQCEVVVDFTVAAAARTTLPWLAMHGMHAVVGTTGFTDDDLSSFRSAFSGSNCLIAANFAISAVLMMRFAELAAPFFDTAEIIELHHDQKIDAPSGTAMLTADRMAAASKGWAEDPTRTEVVAGARGGRGPEGRECPERASRRLPRPAGAAIARRHHQVGPRQRQLGLRGPHAERPRRPAGVGRFGG